MADSTVVGGPTGPDGDVSAVERIDWLKRHLLVVLLLLCVLAIAVTGVLFASGVFTTSSATAANIFGTGTLLIENDHEGKGVLTASNMVPGDEVTGDVTIRNVGTLPAHFSLFMEGLGDIDHKEGSNQELSAALHLRIVNTGSEAPVYVGNLAAMPEAEEPIPLPGEGEGGIWDSGEEHTYEFTVTLPSGTGNEFQNTQTQAVFVWSAAAGG